MWTCYTCNAHCLKTIKGYKNDKFIFETLSGDLIVQVENETYHLDFPARMPIECDIPENISKSLNIQPKEVLKSRDYVLIYESEIEIKNIKINKHFFDEVYLENGGIIVSSVGENCDFVSRFFTPQASILEDPVTGSTHCSLIPFWANRLNKNELSAMQISERIGKLDCINKENRVQISGKARTYCIGNIWIE
jgi:predicted PhzF superfamily epimerase YddE/YHI9